MRTYIFLIIFLIAVVGLIYVGLSKLDAEPPRIIVDEPKANTRYVASDRWIAIHIKATVRDDKAIKSIRIELWGTTIDGDFANAKTLFSKTFDSTSIEEYSIDRTVTANLNGYVLPGWYYVRFVVEDFIGNKRIVWIKIYIDVSPEARTLSGVFSYNLLTPTDNAIILITIYARRV